MNASTLERAAEERLLDAALTELHGGGAAEPAGRHGGAVPSAAARWFAAAMLLLGGSVILAVALLARAERPGPVPAQQPELPPPLRADGRAALAGADRGTENLWCILAPGDLPLLAEFTLLRRLQLEPVPGAGRAAPVRWSLAPLADCRTLTSLAIGNLPGFAPAELDAVAQLPQLTELQLAGTGHLLDPAFVAALQKLPLRALSLHSVGFTPAGFAALCGLPLLERLELRDCLHLDRCELARLRQLRQLRALALRGVGGRLAGSLAKAHALADGQQPPPPKPSVAYAVSGLPPAEERLLLDAAVMRALADLPQLTGLDLRDSVVDAAAMAALPPRLVGLDLGATASALPPAAILALAQPGHLPQLQRLSFRVGTVLSAIPIGATWEQVAADLDAERRATLAWAQLLQTRMFEQLTVRGPVEGALGQALGHQQRLQQLALEQRETETMRELIRRRQVRDRSGRTGPPLDLSFVARMPALHTLSLTFAQPFDPTPLQQHPQLRQLDLHHCDPGTIAAARSLGEGVQVFVRDD